MSTSSVLGTGAHYDPQTDSWTPTTLVNAPGPRFDHSAVWTGDEMIVWGGSQKVGSVTTFLDSGGRYAPILDAASQMKEPCAARRSGERAGSFAVRGAEGIPPEPDGWLPAAVAREGEPADAGTPAEASGLLAGATCP